MRVIEIIKSSVLMLGFMRCATLTLKPALLSGWIG
jgi:hypothetical protein